MDFPEKYKQLWSDWGIRVLMLISRFIQIILIFLGRLRKTSTSKWIRMFVWSSYLLANWVANFVLGQLSNAMDDSSSSNAIIAFWAPFLILHLGCPDTITAYSLEDNELWPRHLLGLIYELIIAFYVLVRSLPSTRLLTPTILIFLVSIIKYAERSYSLYKSSTEGFRSSIISSTRKPPLTVFDLPITNTSDLNVLNKAFWSYSTLNPLFIDFYPKNIEDLVKISVIRAVSEDEIFELMNMELSYAYDKFYTKAAVNHSRVGYVLRALCSICILVAFCLFVLAPKDGFYKLDVSITYVLLVASIFLDVMATIMFLFSDWMIVTLLNVKKLRNLSKLLVEHIFRIKRMCLKRKYLLGEMPQLNLISNCFKNYALNKAHQRSMMGWIKEKLSSVHETKSYLSGFLELETFTLLTLQPIQGIEKLDIITKYARDLLEDYSMYENNNNLDLFPFQEFTIACDWVDPTFFKHIGKLPFDQKVLLWHICTELCFHWKSESLHPLHDHQIEIEVRDNKYDHQMEIEVGENKQTSSKMEVCKYLSNYMMYMVLMRPEIMSTMRAESQLLFRVMCENILEFVCSSVDNNHLLMSNAKVEKVCRKMMITPLKKQDDYVLGIAIVLAYVMLLFENEERWKVMTKVWVHLLILGAQNTKAITHLKQLSRGSELFTFIWLLTKQAMVEGIWHVEASNNENLPEMANELLSTIKDHLPRQH